MSSAAYAKYEDSTLRKVLGVCLDDSQANAGGSPAVLFLGPLAEVSARRRPLALPAVGLAKLCCRVWSQTEALCLSTHTCMIR